jgi:uncharacterized protein
MTDYLDKLRRWREDRDRFFAEHYATPLSDDAIANFNGLRYFLPDPEMVFAVEFEPDPQGVEIESSTGTRSEYPGAGLVSVPFAAGTIELRVLRGEDDDLFIPFRDETSGESTYVGGRYIAVDRSEQGGFRVDFNKATNPYCAYDPDFSCPLPPPQNRLPFAVRAGELDYP